MKNKKNFQILRRSFLGGLAATGAGALVRPLVAQAQSATGAPQRILHIHRPCGSEMTKWWPTGGTTDWVSSPLISSCLLYTSDAADERSSVDLGGRRII